jgi:hypothetical protein
VQATIPSEISSRVRFVDLDDGSDNSAATQTYAQVQTGPGFVLVLMSFEPEYEQFFLDVVKPTVENVAGRENCCIRLNEPMNEWRTEMRRALARADAVLADVSHDAHSGLSINVIWELGELYNEMTKSGDTGLRRDRILCFARGLDHVSSHTEDEFVYSADVNEPWFPLVERSMNLDDLRGLKIYRYRPADRDSIYGLQSWLSSSLSPWVQGIAAPVTDDEIYHNAMRIAELAFKVAPAVWIADTSRYRELSKVDFSRVTVLDQAKLWLLAIAERNFHACGILFERTGGIPDGLQELFGWLIASVSAGDAYRVRNYWAFARAALKDSPTFRTHLLNLLESKQTHADHWSLNNFRENAWLSFGRVKPSDATIDRLRRIASLEEDTEIKRTIDDVLVGFLPEERQEEEKANRLMQYLLRSGDN